MKHPQRWRPRLWMVLAIVLGGILATPIGSIYVFRIYENQLILQTEAELIAQSAAIAPVFARQIAQSASDAPRGAVVPPADPAEPYAPLMPSLDLTTSQLLQQRPAALAPSHPPSAGMLAAGEALAPLLADIQRVTLAGFRLTDAEGVVVGGREEHGLSLAHVEEVAAALGGQYRSALRLRVLRREAPPLYSISRGTLVRVFTAMPVVVDGRVAGVVYASRTPSNIMKHLYDQRIRLALAGGLVLLIGGLLGWVLHRTIARPVRALIARTDAIARGDQEALRPIPLHGTAEFAHLAQSFLGMASELRRRSDTVSTFAAHVSHELKSPLTAIRGAAELLRDAEMTAEERQRFLDNIIADSTRLSLLLARLRELARMETPPPGGTSRLADIVPGVASQLAGLAINVTGGTTAIAMSDEYLAILVTQLCDNALSHGATRIDIAAKPISDRLLLTFADNGSGISDGNVDRIFDAFFTTRREDGGTGMGLAIMRALLQAHGGTIELVETSPDGTTFRIELPEAPGS